MKSECCHQHPDNGDLATQDPTQREETDLRATNAKLLEALEELVTRLSYRNSGIPTMAGDPLMSQAAIDQARAAIKEARK